MYIGFLRNILRFIAILLKAAFSWISTPFKALANPVRREILVWLKEPEVYFSEQAFSLENGVCAGQIDARCDMSQSTVSAHLATLHKAGLVSSKRVGQWIFFKRDEAVIQAFLDQLRNSL